MTWVFRSAGRSRGPRAWWILSGALLVAGALCIPLGLQVHHHALAPPVAPHSTFRAVAVSPVVLAPTVERSTPVALRIPAIGLSVALTTLGLNPDGTVQVPDNDSEPGWFRLGPSPGQTGSAVILGHVDTYQGPGIFFNLRELQANDQVQVTLTDGAVITFAVTSVIQYPKAQFPALDVYQSQGPSTLHLVTCGGVFDPETGHYLSNVVVSTSFVSASAPTVRTVPISSSPVQI
jgi:sortase family protein